MIEAKGINGTLVLSDNKVTISRKGLQSFLLQGGIKGDKDIYLNQITSVQFKKAGLLNNGFIELTFMGGTESKGGLLNAMSNENSVSFKANQEKSFIQIKNKIDECLINKQNQPIKSLGGIDDLEKLAELKNKGIITQEEFDAKKKQILGI